MDKIKEVQEWFLESVTYKGGPYIIDQEQAAAVIDESKNTIVVARAGSGKTRTIVAKIVYLVVRKGISPDEIMVFVFNANAAAEINERMAEMQVDKRPVFQPGFEVEIASTFHAFSRKIVFEICEGREKCGEILAEMREEFVLEMVKGMLKSDKWGRKIAGFINEDYEAQDLTELEIVNYSRMMALFIGRAQQKYLGGETTLNESIKKYLSETDIEDREKRFIELGVECYRRYHWYLLDSKRGLKGFYGYGTDFNLIVSWASKLIEGGRKEIMDLLLGKKYILIDEYQDFSQLFLAAVKAVRMVAGDAKLFVVGDDWQAINRFAGSEVEFFKEFEKFFPDDVRRLEITTNYRCNREIVTLARKFMKKAMKEKGNFRAFKKENGDVIIVNPKETEYETAFFDYDKRISEEDKFYRKVMKKVLEKSPKGELVRYLKTVVEIIEKNKDAEDILILHRNNMMNLGNASLDCFYEAIKIIVVRFQIMEKNEFLEKVRVLTMHKSKGLEADVVIILEADEGVIPKTHSDTFLYSVFGETIETALDDQRRLFYVAKTRAKIRLYIIHNKMAGKGFIKYLKKF